jgi:hypothetical protein
MTEGPSRFPLRRKDDGPDPVEIEPVEDRTQQDLVRVHSDPQAWDWIVDRQCKLTHWLTR